MASLTSDQRTDMQGDLGIGMDESVFTNNELDRLYTRASEDYNTAVYLGVRQLLMSATKFHDYTAGMTKVEKSQVFDHLEKTLAMWKEEARVAGDQVKVVGINRIPPYHKDKPGERGADTRPLWWKNDPNRL